MFEIKWLFSDAIKICKTVLQESQNWTNPKYIFHLTQELNQATNMKAEGPFVAWKGIGMLDIQ